MRFEQVRARAWRCALIAAGLAGTMMIAPAHAVPLVFPTDQSLVPVAVAGAFALPAILAALYGVARRFWRGLGAAIGLGLMAVLGVAVAGYFNPDLLAMLRL